MGSNEPPLTRSGKNVSWVRAPPGAFTRWTWFVLPNRVEISISCRFGCQLGERRAAATRCTAGNPRRSRPGSRDPLDDEVLAGLDRRRGRRGRGLRGTERRENENADGQGGADSHDHPPCGTSVPHGLRLRDRSRKVSRPTPAASATAQGSSPRSGKDVGPARSQSSRSPPAWNTPVRYQTTTSDEVVSPFRKPLRCAEQAGPDWPESSISFGVVRQEPDVARRRRSRQADRSPRPGRCGSRAASPSRSPTRSCPDSCGRAWLRSGRRMIRGRGPPRPGGGAPGARALGHDVVARTVDVEVETPVRVVAMGEVRARDRPPPRSRRPARCGRRGRMSTSSCTDTSLPRHFVVRIRWSASFSAATPLKQLGSPDWQTVVTLMLDANRHRRSVGSA